MDKEKDSQPLVTAEEPLEQEPPPSRKKSMNALPRLPVRCSISMSRAISTSCNG